MQLLASFTEAQTNLIITLAVVFAVLFAGNAALLVVLLYKRKKRKLFTQALQQRREELLEELAALRYFKPKEKEDEDKEEAEEIGELVLEESEIVDDEIDDDEGSENERPQGVRFAAEILAVRDMSALMREHFGFIGAQFDRKCYYVRCAYSFEAKLRAASRETKILYAQLMDEVARYPGLKVKRGFRQERIYSGRKTFAILVFKGKTLCIAMALDPADYADTKYRGKDMTQIKRYAQTPMLIRITSTRRMRYIKYLIAQLSALRGIESTGEAKRGKYNLGAKTRNELFARDLVKIAILGEAPDLEGNLSENATGEDEVAVSDGRFRLNILPVSEMSPLMRKRLGLAGAEYDKKRYFVRFVYGFESRLRYSSQEVKERYASFVDETGLYKKLIIRCGFRQQRIFSGHKTVGLILFKGKTLCVALALDPKKYENTKYRAIDASDIKRFEKTPMLVKITSDRRLGYAKYLLNRLAEERGLPLREQPAKLDYTVDELTFDELYASNLVKVLVIGEVPDGVKD